MTIESISFKNSPAIRISTASGQEAVVLLHGAQVVSWKVNGEERLYLSEKADLAAGAAIRGGIPLCFPQFSTLGSLPMHGFARNKAWHPASTKGDTQGTSAVLELSETPETRALWPHNFKAALTVSLTDTTLAVQLGITNTGNAPLSFTTALHTYFRVKDISEVAIDGLKDTRYHDKVANLADQTEPRDTVRFSEQTDRVYYDASPDLTLHDGSSRIAIHADAMPDTVVWNPWVERARDMIDLPDDGYKYMVCIEAGCIGQPVTLDAGQSWKGGQTLKA